MSETPETCARCGHPDPDGEPGFVLHASCEEEEFAQARWDDRSADLGRYVTAWSTDLREHGRELVGRWLVMAGEFVAADDDTGLYTYRDPFGEFVAAPHPSYRAGRDHRVMFGQVGGFVFPPDFTRPPEFGIHVRLWWPLDDVLAMAPEDFGP